MKKLIFTTMLIVFFPMFSHASEIFKCNKNGAVIFQSKPCSGHTGKTTANKLNEEKSAREARLTEIKEKEEKFQERLNQPREKPSLFKRMLLNTRNYFTSFWKTIKQLFGAESAQ